MENNPEVRRKPILVLDSRALILDGFFRTMTFKQLGKFMSELNRRALAGETDFEFPQKTDFKFVHKVKYAPLGPRQSKVPLDVYRAVISVGYCAICGTTESLTVDHIIPYSRGGGHNRENLQCLCKSCNCRKGAR